jgi:hypothetical protein
MFNVQFTSIQSHVFFFVGVVLTAKQFDQKTQTVALPLVTPVFDSNDVPVRHCLCGGDD